MAVQYPGMIRSPVAESKTAPLILGVLLAGSACSSPLDELGVAEQQHAIQGGYVDETTSGVVGLGINVQDHFFLGHCSGTLIAPNLVLTARHCVTQLPTSEEATEVECGVTDFRRTRDPSSLVISPETERPETPLDPSFVEGSSIHPVPGADDVCGFDVALVILSRSLEPAEAQPIVPRIDRPPSSREFFSAGGYGLTSDDDSATSGRRMRIDGKQVLCGPEECYLEYPEIVTQAEWVSADAGVCSGDSGGPALDAEGRVMGVASRGGDGCRATIYGDVASWGDFIIDIALRAAEEGGYPAPFWTDGSSEGPDPAKLAGSMTDPGDAVVLDEPDDEGAKASGHGDVECDPNECSEPVLAEEGGCALSPRPSRPGLAIVLLPLAVFGLLRRRRG